MEIDLEIFPTAILALLLMQEGHLSISGEKMCTITGEPLRGLNLHKKKCGLGKLTAFDMTPGGSGGGGC